MGGVRVWGLGLVLQVWALWYRVVLMIIRLGRDILGSGRYYLCGLVRRLVRILGIVQSMVCWGGALIVCYGIGGVGGLFVG